jgi:anti-sigma regulatory factor (Ser/Thr protein kinase)
MMHRAHSLDAAPRRFRLVVPGLVGERPRALRFVTELCRAHGVVGDVEHELVSAFGEAFNHAVLHGYRDVAGTVIVEVELARDEIAIAVRDRGRGFADVDDAEAQASRRYGLFIMLRAMDEVRWYHEDDENVVVMVKRLPRQTT